MEHAQRTLAHGGSEHGSSGASGSERYANKAQAVKGVGGLLENIARINQRGFEEEAELERQYETQVYPLPRPAPTGCPQGASYSLGLCQSRPFPPALLSASGNPELAVVIAAAGSAP